MVEISRTSKKVFFLLFPNFEKPKNFLLEAMTEKQAMKLMSDSDNSFENIVGRLYIKFGRLQIDGIHGKGGYRVHKSVSPFRVKPEKSHGLTNENTDQGFSVHKSILTADPNNHPHVVSSSTNDFP